MRDNDNEDKIIKNNRFYDAELKIINPFLEELKGNQSVECISIMPSYIERDENSFCSIRIIIYAMGNSNEFEYIQNSINSFLGELFYKKYKIINNISVEIEDAALQLELKEQGNILNGKNIVSSYIVYDRNGIFTELQEELTNIIKPWGSIIELENIDELINKQKVYSKTREF